MVSNCHSFYNNSGFQAKGHANTKPAYNVKFLNCLAEYCHFGFYGGGDFHSNDYGNTSNILKNIIIENCTAKNMYIFNNATDWVNDSLDIQFSGIQMLTILNFTSINGNPYDNSEIKNISSKPRSNYCRFRELSQMITIENFKGYNYQNYVATQKYFSFDGACRNVSFKDIFFDGYTGGSSNVKELIKYGSSSNKGYCRIDTVAIAKKINSNDSILNIASEVVQGERKNMLYLNL